MEGRKKKTYKTKVVNIVRLAAFYEEVSKNKSHNLSVGKNNKNGNNSKYIANSFRSKSD